MKLRTRATSKNVVLNLVINARRATPPPCLLAHARLPVVARSSKRERAAATAAIFSIAHERSPSVPIRQMSFGRSRLEWREAIDVGPASGSFLNHTGWAWADSAAELLARINGAAVAWIDRLGLYTRSIKTC